MEPSPTVTPALPLYVLPGPKVLQTTVDVVLGPYSSTEVSRLFSGNSPPVARARRPGSAVRPKVNRFPASWATSVQPLIGSKLSVLTRVAFASPHVLFALQPPTARSVPSSSATISNAARPSFIGAAIDHEPSQLGAMPGLNNSLLASGGTSGTNPLRPPVINTLRSGKAAARWPHRDADNEGPIVQVLLVGS